MQLLPAARGGCRARPRPRRPLCVRDAVGPNLFMQQIHSYLGEMTGWLSARRLAIEIVGTDVFDPSVFAASLEGLISGDYDDVAALDHSSVRSALNDLVGAGIKVAILVSNVTSSGRNHYMGIDNIAAGCTAGALLGPFVGTGRAQVPVNSRSSRARRACATMASASLA